MNLTLIDEADRHDSWTRTSGAPLFVQVPAAVVLPVVSAVGGAITHAAAPNVEVRKVLNNFLPKPAMDLIESGRITDLQGVMNNKDVSVDSFLSIFGGTESANKCVQEFGFTRIRDWNEPCIEIYYVRLQARFESTRFLYMHRDENTLTAEYKMKRYRISPAQLREYIPSPYQARYIMQEWLDKAIC